MMRATTFLLAVLFAAAVHTTVGSNPHNTATADDHGFTPGAAQTGGSPDHPHHSSGSDDEHDEALEHAAGLEEDDHEPELDREEDRVSHIPDHMVCKDGNCQLEHEEDTTLIVGAVAYDPKVVTFWESVKSYVTGPERNLEMDFVLYSTYERLVEALLHGFVHVVWASPLAYVELEAVAKARELHVAALAMRDTDQGQKSFIVVPKDSPLKSLNDLKGKTVAVGAADSPQGTLIPLYYIKEMTKMNPKHDFTVQRHDLLVGKHGDHIAGEREAAKALVNNTADAVCLAESSYRTFIAEGIFKPDSTRVLGTTHEYDHFTFAVLHGGDETHEKDIKKFQELLLAMDYSNPTVAAFMDLENTKKWLPGRTSGYNHLRKSVEEFGYIRDWLFHHGAADLDPSTEEMAPGHLDAQEEVRAKRAAEARKNPMVKGAYGP